MTVVTNKCLFQFYFMHILLLSDQMIKWCLWYHFLFPALPFPLTVSLLIWKFEVLLSDPNYSFPLLLQKTEAMVSKPKQKWGLCYLITNLPCFELVLYVLVYTCSPSQLYSNVLTGITSSSVFVWGRYK